MIWQLSDPPDFFCSGIQFYALLSPYLCFISFFQGQLSIINFTLNYPPIRNNLTSASLLSMLIETDCLNYPSNQKQSFICKSAIVLRRRNTKDTKQYLIKCFRSMTMASLLSMRIETDYNFNKTYKNKTQNFFNIITFCLKYVGAICFVVSGSAPVAHFTRLCLKAVTEPNSTELAEYSLF